MAGGLNIAAFHGLELSGSLRTRLGNAFAAAGADEGTLWLLDEKQEALVPVWNSGPNAGAFVGRHRQPLTAGLISLVCVTEQALCENRVYQNTRQDPTLDRQLGVLTCAMIAVPLRMEGVTRGVVSCVRLKTETETLDPPPFTPADLARMAEAVEKLNSA